MKSLKQSPAAGFTLMELLVALAILGILFGIAYPSYQQSVLRSRRADGVAAALTIKAAQERFRGSCQFYAQTLSTTAADNCATTAGASTVKAITTSSEGYYTLSIAASSATGNAYTLNITPTGTQAKDTDCSPMTLTVSATNPSGAKGPTGCW
jgi:type IV pilus assembly protein PilE